MYSSVYSCDEALVLDSSLHQDQQQQQTSYHIWMQHQIALSAGGVPVSPRGPFATSRPRARDYRQRKIIGMGYVGCA